MIKQKNHYLWVVALLLIVSSCSSVKEMTYMQDLPEGQSRTVLETIGYKDPMIESGDILSINVSTIDPTTPEAINQSMMIPAIGYSSTNSSVSSQQVIAGFPVDEEGNITMNYTGKIHVGGLTLAQAREKVESEVAKYFKNAVVNIAYTNFRVTVLGEVNAPGKYPLKSKTTLLQAITIAHGFTQVAARNKIVVFRFGKDGEGLNKIKASYDDIVLRDGSDQNIELKPGDQIVVPSETMVVLPAR